MRVSQNLLGQNDRMNHPRSFWLEFQQLAEAPAHRITLMPHADEDQHVTSERGVIIIRSDGAPDVFILSPFTSFPLHPASFFNVLIRSTNIRGA